MAKIDLKFIDLKDYNTTIEVLAQVDNNLISIYAVDKRANNCGVCIHLDKSTAIKFAKTLRTEINKIEY